VAWRTEWQDRGQDRGAKEWQDSVEDRGRIKGRTEETEAQRLMYTEAHAQQV